MKSIKTTFILALMVLTSAIGAKADTLLTEDFEGSTFPPTGWTVIDSDVDGAINHWKLYNDNPLGGKQSAHVCSPSYSENEPAKEEMLVTPELDLQGTYKLQFAWEGATHQSLDKQEYDFQVRVQVSGTDTWDTIWSMVDRDDVVNSGVDYPWTAWTAYVSNVDLSAYQGKKVKIAFVYCLLIGGEGKGNCIWLDNVSVESHTPATSPQAELSLSSYIFPTAYIGAKKYSETITLSNTGRDVLKVTSIEGIDGTDFGTTLKPEAVELEKGDKYSFQVYYEPTVTGLARATMTINCNGGDPVSISLQGSKTLLPDGYSYEGFEGDVFPPLGWTVAPADSYGWTAYGSGMSGDRAAYCAITDSSELVSPRLDLSGDEEYKITFDYYDEYTASTDDATAPSDYVDLMYSTDGGATWKTLWTNDYYNETIRKEFSLGTPKSDNCYVKFVYSIPGLDLTSYDDVPDYSVMFLDDVILPPLYGSQSAPKPVTIVSPADKATGVANRRLTLNWNGSQFATNYKLYVGKAAGTWDIVDGEDLGTATSYELPNLDYATTYYWQVVASNSYGSAEGSATWQFTTLADQTISTYPYFEGFESGDFAAGWQTVKDAYTHWAVSGYSSFDGSYSALASGNDNNTCAVLETPDFLLPEGSKPVVSFYWGNRVPAGLTVDPTGTVTNPTTEVDDIDAVYFDVYADGEYVNKAVLCYHPTGDDPEEYYYRESVDLSQYAGKRIMLRWRYNVVNGMKAHGCALDNISVKLVSDGECLAFFNKEEWNAGDVNYNRAATSGDVLSIGNGGTSELEVSSVAFTASNFTTTLAAGTKLASNEVKTFSIDYAAGTTAGTVSDEMVVNFTNGQTAKLPVSGTTLGKDVLYFNFDNDEHGSTSPKGLTTIDYDGVATVPPTLIYYPNRGTAFAFIVLNVDKDHANWQDVYPRSGEQVLAGMRDTNNEYDTNDWIISPRLTATESSKFRFFAEGYGNDSQFDKSNVKVLVTTGDNIYSQSAFTTVMEATELEWHTWNEYTVDLSSYAGQEVNVALVHTAPKAGFVSFFDDFYYEGFADASSLADGISSLTVMKTTDNSEIYNIAGQKLNNMSKPGLYIVNGKKTVVK